MVIASVFIAAVAATTAMTLFSYIYSAAVRRPFREPELLNLLLDRWAMNTRGPSKSSLIGWFIHYGVGLVFMGVFYVVWQVTELDLKIGTGALMGFLAGIVGVVGWHLAFKIHPNPPELTLTHYYIHLILAHVVFGLGAVVSINGLTDGKYFL